MEFNCPKYHKEIIEDLMNGKFILSREKLFEELKECEDYYKVFFEKSFEYELIITQEFAYIVSPDSNENLSRDICIFMSILCYELDKEGVNFLDKIEYNDFTFDEVDRYFDNSSFTDLIQNNNQIKNDEARRNLIKKMITKNIVEKNSEERFSFTSAYKVFIDFAKELAVSKSLGLEENGG